MSKRIITISREFGSGGRTIGKQVAERLGRTSNGMSMQDFIWTEQRRVRDRSLRGYDRGFS